MYGYGHGRLIIRERRRLVRNHARVRGRNLGGKPNGRGLGNLRRGSSGRINRSRERSGTLITGGDGKSSHPARIGGGDPRGDGVLRRSAHRGERYGPSGHHVIILIAHGHRDRRMRAPV